MLLLLLLFMVTPASSCSTSLVVYNLLLLRLAKKGMVLAMTSCANNPVLKKKFDWNQPDYRHFKVFSCCCVHWLRSEIERERKNKNHFCCWKRTRIWFTISNRSQTTLKSRYIKVKVKHYLLFMFSPPEKKLDRLRNKTHLLTFIYCFLSKSALYL